MIVHHLALAALCATAFAAPKPKPRQNASPTVTIASGVVVGTATRVSNQPTMTGLVNAFLGVPFANSPPLRFAPPTKPSPWSSPLQAKALPPACLQQFSSGADGEREREYFNNPGYAPPPESEDCLYLNVFAPQDASPKNLKPVMFWIFGGNLQFGTASLAYYNGSSLAVNHDVVVVVPNYRTNMFGFSNSPEIPFGQQNSGFLDQRFALQWVQQNIKSFGGDPTQVTIFGESAGGYSVKQLLALPPSPLPYRAGIMESQQTSIDGDGLVSYETVLANFNCTLAVSPLECIRKIPGTAIQSYIEAQGLGFPPVQGDGTYVASNSLPEILSGGFADVPILIGTNLNEFTVFLALFGINNVTSVADTFNELTGQNISSIIGQLTNALPSNITDSPFLFLAQLLTDFAFTCTTQTLSDAIVSAGRQPVWRYQYDGVFPDVTIFPKAGAYHTAEIPEVWGTYPLSSAFGKATPTQIALSKYMQGAWATFAKNPSAGPGWPKLGSNNGVELGALGSAANPNGESTQPLSTADATCPLLDPLIIGTDMAY